MNVHASGGYNYSQLSVQSIAARMKQGAAEKAALDVTVNVIDVSPVDNDSPQTIDDVKKEFYDYLDSLPISPGLGNSPISVNITDAAFEKMLADPEYKQKMKDLCKRDMCDPAWSKLPPSGMQITIDADCPEEYLATSWNAPDGGRNVDRNGFWTKGAKDKKAARKAQEKREMLEFLQEKADQRKRLANERVQAAYPGRGAGVYASLSGQDLGASAAFADL